MNGCARCLSWSALLAMAWGCQPAGVDDAASGSDRAGEPRTVSADAYRRAERFLLGRQDEYVLNASVTPNWIGAGDRFWYRRALAEGGTEFVTVTAATGARQPSFDHALVARELSRLDEDEEYAATTLPFETFTFNDDGGIDFSVGETFHRCTAEGCTASEPPTPPFTPLETPSPDGEWAAYHERPRSLGAFGGRRDPHPLDHGRRGGLALRGPARHQRLLHLDAAAAGRARAPGEMVAGFQEAAHAAGRRARRRGTLDRRACPRRRQPAAAHPYHALCVRPGRGQAPGPLRGVRHPERRAHGHRLPRHRTDLRRDHRPRLGGSLVAGGRPGVRVRPPQAVCPRLFHPSGRPGHGRRPHGSGPVERTHVLARTGHAAAAPGGRLRGRQPGLVLR